VTFGVDHIQNSDRTTAHFVGLNFEDLDNGNTNFKSSVGANTKESIGAVIIQKTTFGSFSALYVPANGVNGGDDDLDGMSENSQGPASTVTNLDRASAYEIGFVGDFGVKGLNVHAFKNKEKSNVGSLNATTGLDGTNIGVSYNFGQFTVGADRKKSTGNYSATNTGLETKQNSFGAAFAITPNLTLGASYAKAETSTQTTDEKAKTIALGYNLGPVVAEVQYGQFENVLNAAGADSDVFFARLLTKF